MKEDDFSEYYEDNDDISNLITTPEKVEEEPAEYERPRFGIGSLINRMSGGSESAPKAQPSVRSQPATSVPAPAAEEGERSQEQEKIEIPAFLRRQAN